MSTAHCSTVGDEKQSIFSFQHADPAGLTEMRDLFARRIGAAKKLYEEIELQVSYRSAPAVLTAVDAVFARPEASAGVSTAQVKHIPRHPDMQGRVEVWDLLPKAEKDKGGGAWPLPLEYEEEHDPQAELAARIAAKISGWLKKGEALPGVARPIAPGDIMILLRRRGRFADLMVRALKKSGVAVTGVDRMHLIKQLPVMDLLALLQFALLPEDELNLATVLRGPFVNLSEDRLMELALGRKDGLWQTLIARAAKDAELAKIHAYLASLLADADFLTPFAMLSRILNSVCPAHAVGGRRALWARLGPDALDPVEELLNAAQNFTRRNAPSLQAFLHWLTASDTEIKRELESEGGTGATPGGGQVRIMTVHAAKGLEAPIVFLPDTASLPRTQDVAEFLWAGDVPLYAPRQPKGGVARQLWEDARRLQLEEYRRLLYVALTRAAHRLYIGGWETREAKDGRIWYRLIADGLRPLHEPSSAEGHEPAPTIALADQPLHPPPKPAAVKGAALVIPLPEWVFAPAPAEEAAAHMVAPSRLALPPASAAPDGAFARGRVIHRLLQSLPEVEDARREDAARRFLANPQHHLTQAQQQEIADEVLKLLRDPRYVPLFGPGSRAEVPLAGVIGSARISGQVDRLCLREDGVWVVDYKTNRPPPARAEDIQEAYRLQMAEYRALLQAIYPGKTVRCFLLWTYGPRLMELPA